MRIKEFKAENYRLFDSIEFSFGKAPCLVVVDDNERGKSTILQGILDCLYTRRKDCATGETGRIQLSFELGSDEYMIIVAKEKKRLLKNGEDITGRFYKKVGRSYEYLFGEKLFGLNEEEFLNTAFVRQHELDRLEISNKGLATKIQSMVELTQEEHSPAKAIQLLREGINKNFPRITVKTVPYGDAEQEVKKLDLLIFNLEREKEALNRRIQDGLEILRAFEETEQTIRKTDEELRQTEALKKAAILNEDNIKRERISRIKENIERLRPYPQLTSKDADTIEDRLRSAFAAWESIQERLKRNSSEVERKIKELESIQEELSSYGALKDKTLEDSSRLDEIARQLEEIEIEQRRTTHEIEEAMKRFRPSIDEFERMDGAFSRLSDSDRNILHNYRAERAEYEEIIQKLERLRSDMNLRNIAGLASVLSFMISATGFFLHPALLLFLIPAIASAVLFFRINGRVNTIREDEKLRQWLKENPLDSLIEDIGKRILYLDESLRRLEESTGFRLDDYHTYTQWAGEFHDVKARQQSLEALKKRKETLLREVISIWPFEDEITPLKIRTLAGRIRECVKVSKRLSDKTHEIRILEEQLREDEREGSARERTLRDIISVVRSKMEEETITIEDTAEGIENLVDDTLKALERAKQAETLRQELSEIRTMPDDERAQLEADLQKTEINISSGQLETASYYEERIRALQERAAMLHERRSSLLMKSTDLMEASRLLNSLERELERYRAHKRLALDYMESVRRAIALIDELSKSQYQLWAERLNRETSRIFQSITGTDRTIRFGKSLNFIIYSDGRELTDDEVRGYLSGGALEQLYLSIRVAIARHISPEIRLPLLLDEPFAHADDSRFIAAMRYLIEEVSRERQVIVFSCHRKRHEMLRSVIKEGYEIRDSV